MMSIFFLLAAMVQADAPTPYQRASALAIADDIPLVVFVGCDRQAVPGAWCCRVAHLDGYQSPCVVVAAPSAGQLLWSRTLPASASIDEIAGRTRQATAPDALDEVNAKRAGLGLRPLIRDDALTAGAAACAAARAAGRIAGHTRNDFAYLPSGATATAAGCAALDLSWGWQSCCWDGPQWTTAGAAAVMGADGLRYMHIFCR